MRTTESQVEDQVFEDQDTARSLFSVRNMAIGAGVLVLVAGGAVFMYKDRLFGENTVAATGAQNGGADKGAQVPVPTGDGSDADKDAKEAEQKARVLAEQDAARLQADHEAARVLADQILQADQEAARVLADQILQADQEAARALADKKKKAIRRRAFYANTREQKGQDRLAAVAEQEARVLADQEAARVQAEQEAARVQAGQNRQPAAGNTPINIEQTGLYLNVNGSVIGKPRSEISPAFALAVVHTAISDETQNEGEDVAGNHSIRSIPSETNAIIPDSSDDKDGNSSQSDHEEEVLSFSKEVDSDQQINGQSPVQDEDLNLIQAQAGVDYVLPPPDNSQNAQNVPSASDQQQQLSLIEEAANKAQMGGDIATVDIEAARQQQEQNTPISEVNRCSQAPAARRKFSFTFNAGLRNGIPSEFTGRIGAKHTLIGNEYEYVGKNIVEFGEKYLKILLHPKGENANITPPPIEVLNSIDGGRTFSITVKCNDRFKTFQKDEEVNKSLSDLREAFKEWNGKGCKINYRATFKK